MSVFLDACRGKRTPYTPVWLMRQAGRYQASYRAIREKVSFLELCADSDLCAQVAVQAVDDLGVDAAIVFADILLVLTPLGIGFEFTKDDGPRIQKPIRSAADVEQVATEIDAKESLGYVMESVRKTKAALGGRVPLIGFSGAPFTLASYVIEGGGSREYLETKKLMFGDEGAWHELMRRLSGAVTGYLKGQIEAGAQAVQLFDSWVGALGPGDYARYVMPHMKTIIDSLGKDVPVIHFGTGYPALLPLMREAGGDVIGLDQRADFASSRSLLGPDVAVQGNLDPVALLAPREVLLRKAGELIASNQGAPGHIFNLGHGVLPKASVEQARALVDYVHEVSAR